MPQPKVLPARGSSAHHEHARLLPVHEALRDGVWCQDLISEGKKEADQFTPKLQSRVAWNISERVPLRTHSVADVEFLSLSLRKEDISQVPFCSLLRLNGTRKTWCFLGSEWKLTVDHFTHSGVSSRLGFLMANGPVSACVTPDGHSSLP